MSAVRTTYRLHAFGLLVACLVFLVATLVSPAFAEAQVVTGVVMDYVTKVPIAQVQVALYRGVYHQGTVVTDAAGKYAFATAPNTSYRLRFDGPANYRDESTTLTTPDSSVATVTRDCRLHPYGYIGGRVVSESGAPLAGISVEVELLWGFWGPWGTATTDANGRFTAGLFDSSMPVRIRFTDPTAAYSSEYFDDQWGLSSATLLYALEGRERDLGNVVLAKRGTISGRITSELDGAALAGIPVSLYQTQNDGTQKVVMSRVSDADGRYSFTQIDYRPTKIGFSTAAGPWMAEFNGNAPSFAAAVSLYPHGNIAGVDAVLRHDIHIRGRMYGSDGDVLSLHRKTGLGSWTRVAQLTTTFPGNFDFGGQVPGEYRLQYTWQPPFYTYHPQNEWFSDAWSLWDSQPIVAVANANADIGGWGVAYGTLVRGRVISGETGLPVRYVDVELWKKHAGEWQPVWRTSSGSEGLYGFYALPGSEYAVRLAQVGLEYEFWGGGFYPDEAHVFEVVANGLVDGVVLETNPAGQATVKLTPPDPSPLLDRTTRFSGSVLANGEPVVNGWVNVVLDAGSPGGNKRYYSTRTDAAGLFSLDATPTAPVQVKAVFEGAPGLCATSSASFSLVPTRIVRESGTDRYATAIEITRSHYPDTVETVILTTGASFPDALCATPLAEAFDAPLLLVRPTGIDPGLRAELIRLAPERIVVIGGDRAVPGDVLRDLEDLPFGPVVERVAGADRYATSAAVAARLVSRSGNPAGVVIATGQNFADALAAAPIAARKGWPLLLTRPTLMPPAVDAIVRGIAPQSALVVGGTTAVAESAVAGIPARRRIAGTDRYATAVSLMEYAEETGGPSTNYGFTTGANFPDALAIGPVIARDRGVLVLTAPNRVPEVTVQALESRKGSFRSMIVVGGELAVPSQLVAHVRRSLGSPE